MRGAKVSGLPVRSYQFDGRSSSCSAAAPGCVMTIGGSLRSGRSSVKPLSPGPPLRKLGRERPSWSARSPRNPDSRAMSAIGPPGTFSSPRWKSGSVPISIVP